MERFRQFIVGFLNKTTKEKSDLKEVTATDFPLLDKVGIDANILNTDDIFADGSLASAPTVYNVSVPNSSTEVSQALTNGVKQFLIRVRGNAELRLAYVETESGSNFITIPAGSSMAISGLRASNLTLYFQTDKSSQIVEIQEWV